MTHPTMSNNDSGPDNKSTTANIDPFNEDDPSTKYLTTPFETERYHILSKQQGPQNPYFLDHPVHFPGHPALHGLMHYSPKTTPWRAPAVSYWCRPVNFDPEVLASKLYNLDQANTAEGSDSTRADKTFRSATGLNSITCPYLSVTYADVTGCFGDSRGYRRTTNQALTDLYISMTTAVYNSFLLLEKSRTKNLSSESKSGSETEIGIAEDGNEDDAKGKTRHYGVCIDLRGYSCWVAEPKLKLQVSPPPAGTGTTKDDKNPAGFQHLPPSEPLPSVDMDRDIDTVSNSDSVICTDAEGPTNETNNTSFSKWKSRSQREWEWTGCTITKVAEGRLDRYMDLDVLVEFINRAHEYGMGSFVAGVAADLGVIAETEPEEDADRKEVEDGNENENEWDASTCGIGSFNDDTSGVYDHEQHEDAQPWIDGTGDRFRVESSGDEPRGQSWEWW
ncbi:hypothetical protein V8F33_012560 [Rhypophila sp. PSN 637]